MLTVGNSGGRRLHLITATDSPSNIASSSATGQRRSAATQPSARSLSHSRQRWVRDSTIYTAPPQSSARSRLSQGGGSPGPHQHLLARRRTRTRTREHPIQRAARRPGLTPGGSGRRAHGKGRSSKARRRLQRGALRRTRRSIARRWSLC